MSGIEPRQQIQECRERMYAAQNDVSMHSLSMVCELELAVLGKKLQRCTKDELDRLQGQVEVWVKLQKYIREDPAIAQAQ